VKVLGIFRKQCSAAAGATHTVDISAQNATNAIHGAKGGQGDAAWSWD